MLSGIVNSNKNWLICNPKRKKTMWQNIFVFRMGVTLLGSFNTQKLLWMLRSRRRSCFLKEYTTFINSYMPLHWLKTYKCYINLKVPCSNLAIKMAKQNSQVNWKLTNTIFTHPFHIKSSTEAYFSKYVLNCIDTHPPVYQPHTADIFKQSVGDPKQWRHDKAVRMPMMEIPATCFPDPCQLSIDQSLSISHCQCTSNSHHTLMINHYCPKK